MARKGLTPEQFSFFTKRAGSREEISVDEILGWLLNISFALLMVFIIADFLYATNVKVALDLAKGKIGVLEGENKKLREGDPNVAKYEVEVKEAQKLKLTLALDKIEGIHRDKLGISHFAPKDPSTKETEYKMSDLLLGSKLINERFKEACVFAKDIFSNKEKLRQQWRERIPFIELGLEFREASSESSVISNPEIVTPENETWLFREIANRIEGTYADCRDMQSMALSYFYQHYIKNPELLKGTEIDKRMTNVFSASDQEKERLISQLSQELHIYIKSLFNEQNVPLLDDI